MSKKTLSLGGIILIFVLSMLLLWKSNVNSSQAIPASVIQVYFDGEYKIEDGEWQKIEENTHIPTTKGDVILKGNFHMLTPDGEYIGLLYKDIPIAFYTNHINVTIKEKDLEIVLDNENLLCGNSACAENWIAYSFTYDNEDPIEIIIHNPHLFGNSTAIDDLLDKFCVWNNIDFEKSVLDVGETQRNLGTLYVIISIVILGIALFLTVLYIKNYVKNYWIIWLFGLIVLSAGVYFIFSSEGISFWNYSIVSNTIIPGISMIFYLFFIMILATIFLEKTKKICSISVICMGCINLFVFLLPMATNMHFYDMLLYWIIIQSIVNIIFIISLTIDFFTAKEINKWFCIALFLPLASFNIDVFMNCIGRWKDGVSSRYIFSFIFIIVIIMILSIIPQNINSSIKAKELEVEKTMLNSQLTESRISTMMSQIRPHFIYNTLGSIEQLCELDPSKASELVHNFAKYLRGNFRELANPKPILMSQEMEHVYHYVYIEKVRFPDMSFFFEMKAGDFYIPALSIQPIVENAIKHGLMKLEKGGTIKVVSFETDTHYCVTVEDDGVGFDENNLADEKDHMGISNIRARLKTMVNGELEIKSIIGKGTKVLIKIPREEKE